MIKKIFSKENIVVFTLFIIAMVVLFLGISFMVKNEPNYEHRDYLLIVRNQNGMFYVDEEFDMMNAISLSLLEENEVEYTITDFRAITLFIRHRDDIVGTFMSMAEGAKSNKVMSYIISFSIYENYLVVKPFHIKSFEFISND